ncbi:hypothetical protein EW053_17925 [Streptomyces sp. IB2014 016-6]|nr:hypothetical protein EW053_17925 [Streptomyces sp. IB2014 016-6]
MPRMLRLGPPSRPRGSLGGIERGHECAAAELGLEVWFSSCPLELDPGQILTIFRDCAERAERLRQQGASVVFVAGVELSSAWALLSMPGVRRRAARAVSEANSVSRADSSGVPYSRRSRLGSCRALLVVELVQPIHGVLLLGVSTLLPLPARGIAEADAVGMRTGFLLGRLPARLLSWVLPGQPNAS